MKNKLDERRFTFIAQVDSFFEKKQYQRGGRCIRFIAIDQKDEIKLTSKDQDEERGVNTYTLELTNFIPRKDEYKINENDDVWYKIEGYWTRENPNGYAYLTFGNSEPEYFRFQKRTRISKPHIKSIEVLKNNNNFINNVEICPRSELNNGNALFKFYGFHVGQGLCSLITDSSDYGLLIDAGVGTPIKRNFYQNKLSINDNDLIKIINNIENIDLVLSHADSDHWRLLAWDNILLSKVKNI